MAKVKHWYGLLAAYTAIGTKDTGTLYHVTDEQAIYLGTICIVRSGNTLNTSATGQTKAGALTISGLLTASTLKVSNLTAGYLPYYTAAGLVNSPFYSNGAGTGWLGYTAAPYSGYNYGANGNFYVGGNLMISGAMNIGDSFSVDGNIELGGYVGAASGWHGNLPTTSGGSYDIGTAGTPWRYVYGTTIYEGGVTLASKYAASSHVHGNITNVGAIGINGNTPIITTNGGVLTTGSFGTAAFTFCQGNDGRLSNSRPASDVSAWAKAGTKPTYTYSEVGSARVQGRVVSDCNHADYRVPGMYGFNNNPTNGTGETYGAMIVAANSDTGLQIAGGYSNDDLYFRGWSGSGASYYPWRRLWHVNNSNLTTVDWSAKNLTLAGSITGATTGAFSGDIVSSGSVWARNQYVGYGDSTTPFFATFLAGGVSGLHAEIEWGNEANATTGTWIRFKVNAQSGVNTPVYPLSLGHTVCAFTTYLGIGVTPTHSFEINTGTAQNIVFHKNPSGYYNMMSLNGTTADGIGVGFHGGNGTPHLYINSGNTGDLIFRTGTGASFVEKFRINNNGVGAFTSNLTVGGTLVVTGSITAASFYEA